VRGVAARGPKGSAKRSQEELDDAESEEGVGEIPVGFGR